jgi:hypothetical protein
MYAYAGEYDDALYVHMLVRGKVFRVLGFRV